MPNLEDYKYTPDIEGYKMAVWDFLLEHSKITQNGTLFIKFGATNKKNFENRVLARWKHNYHREDVEAKAKVLKKQAELYRAEKKKKKQAYKEAKKARMATAKIYTPAPEPITIHVGNVHKILTGLKKLIKK